VKKFPAWKGLVTLIEFRAFLGLWLMRGLWGQATSRLSNLYLPGAFPIFSATMPRERFKWILRHLSFDGAVKTEDRNERWRHDRLAAIRHLFEVIVDRWASPIIPDEYLTIDETLYNLYNQVQFKVYNKGKPQKYGVNFKSLNSVSYPYTYCSHVYAGKPVDTPNQFYLSGTDNYTKYLVDYLSERVVLSGRNLTMDRLYTSVDVAEWLYNKHQVMSISYYLLSWFS
jgi:hypothetical protein